MKDTVVNLSIEEFDRLRTQDELVKSGVVASIGFFKYDDIFCGSSQVKMKFDPTKPMPEDIKQKLEEIKKEIIEIKEKIKNDLEDKLMEEKMKLVKMDIFKFLKWRKENYLKIKNST